MKKVLWIGILVLMATTGHQTQAGETLTFAEVDRLTLRYYQSGEWDSLLMIGKEALKAGIDYFYLRARMGAAWYEKGRYAQAVTQYRKAREFNASDPYVNTSLYLSLLKSGDPEMAAATCLSTGEAQQEGNKPDFPLVRSASLGGMMTWSNAGDAFKTSKLMGSDSICGYRDFYGNYAGGSLAVSFGITPRIYLDAGYTYLRFTKQTDYQYAWFEDSLVGHVDTTWGYYNLWTYPRYTNSRSFDYAVNQHEVFLAPRLVLPSGWKGELTAHLVYVSYKPTRMTYTRDTIPDTLYHINTPPFDSVFLFYQDVYGFETIDTSFVNLLVSMRISKKWGVFGLGLQGSWSDFNGKQQYQAGLDLNYTVGGKTGFYGLTGGAGLFREGETPDWIIRQVLGIKAFPWLWVEGAAIYGDYSGGNLANGRYIYNLSDRIRYSFSGSLAFSIIPHLQLVATFLHTAKSNLWYQVHLTNQDLPPNHVTTVTKTVNYHTNSLVLGLHWDF